MPRVGPIFTLEPGYLAVLGETIQPSQHNPVLEDIAQGLTDSLPRNGTGPMTGNLAMGSNKITGLATGTNPGDAVRLDQVTSSAWLSSVSALAFAADEMVYANGVNTAAKTALTAFARTILDDADAATVRTTIGAQPLDADLTAIAALSGTGIAVRTAGNTWAQRTITSTGGTVTITNPGGVAGNINLEANSGGLTLLDTISTTSGATVTSATLNLTSYKQLVLVINGVSTTNASGAIQMGAGGTQFTAPTSAGTDLFRGIVTIDLATGIFGSTVAVMATGNNSGSSSTYGGVSPWTNATTSLTFDFSNGNFDAGSIVVYGAK